MKAEIVKLKTVTGDVVARVSQIAALEDREPECWVFLNSGATFITKEKFNDLFERLKACGWSSDHENS
jgi:hypothetical protein